VENKYCREHCETQHAIYGDGKSNPGIIKKFEDHVERCRVFQQEIYRYIAYIVGAWFALGFYWALTEAFLKIHGKI